MIAVAPASEDAFKGNMVTGEESVRLIPAAVAGLILIGVASSAGRSIYPDSFASRMEPVRSALLRARGSLDPGAAQRPFMVARVDERFGDNRLVTYVHVVLGSVFLLLAPIQFSARLRRQHPGVHRWTGRVLVVTGLAVAIAGLFFGVFIPFAGAAERVVVGVFGGTVIGALITAVLAIRRGEVERHRAWMIRAFSLMLGISTVRIVAAVLDFVLAPLAYSTETIFVASLWLGWGGTLATAELWLRLAASRTPQGRVAGSAVSLWTSRP